MFLLKYLQNAGNAVLDTQNSKFSRGVIPPNPPSRLVPSALERFAPPKVNPAGATDHRLRWLRSIFNEQGGSQL
jgi:hypothetical protein